jgi:3-hydroxybutyryl-CoA dehydratase
MTANQPAALSIDNLFEGTSAEIEFVVTQADMHSFSHLSGDMNPLHLDESFAISKGFQGTVVYGALIIAKISQLIGMRLPGKNSVWSSVNLSFKKPLYVGVAAKVCAVVTARSESTGMIELALKVMANEQILAKGKAEVLIVK